MTPTPAAVFMGICPCCAAEAKYIPPGTSRRTGNPYDEFWACWRSCKDPRSRGSLTWKSQKQWRFLHDRQSNQRNPMPTSGGPPSHPVHYPEPITVDQFRERRMKSGDPVAPPHTGTGYSQIEAATIRRTRSIADAKAFGPTGSKPAPRQVAFCSRGHAYFAPGPCTTCT